MASKREISPGVWQIRVYVGLDAEGHRKYRQRTVRGGVQVANRALNSFAAEVAQAKADAPASGSLGEVIERWLDHLRPNVTPKTWYGYRQLSNRVIADLGTLPLAEVTAKRLDLYYAELLAENIGSTNKPRHRSPATIQRYHAVIRQALAQAVRWDDLPSNPATRTKPPRVIRKEIKPPSPALAAELLDRLGTVNPELATFIGLALSTGMRRGELVALRWSDIDLDAAVIRVHQALAVAGGTVHLKDTKTHAERLVDLDDWTVEVLRRHRALLDRRASLGRGMSPDPWVFSDKADCSMPWNPDLASHRWRRFATRQGHPGVRLHDLRHAMATAWLDAGISPQVVSQRLGHAKVSTTIDIYGHVPDGAQAEAAKQMARSLPRLIELDGQAEPESLTAGA